MRLSKLGNKVQKLLYDVSAASPLCLILAYVWWRQYETWKLPIVLIVIALSLKIAFFKSFNCVKYKLPPIAIKVEQVAPKDLGVVSYVISYTLPFAGVVIKEVNLTLVCIIALMIVLIASFVNSSIPNPLLFFIGYHFYEVNSRHGMAGYILICKKKIRSPKEIKYVNRIFEFLLLDSEV